MCTGEDEAPEKDDVNTKEGTEAPHKKNKKHRKHKSKKKKRRRKGEKESSSESGAESDVEPPPPPRRTTRARSDKNRYFFPLNILNKILNLKQSNLLSPDKLNPNNISLLHFGNKTHIYNVHIAILAFKHSFC